MKYVYELYSSAFRQHMVGDGCNFKQFHVFQTLPGQKRIPVEMLETVLFVLPRFYGPEHQGRGASRLRRTQSCTNWDPIFWIHIL